MNKQHVKAGKWVVGERTDISPSDVIRNALGGSMVDHMIISGKIVWIDLENLSTAQKATLKDAIIAAGVD